MQSEMWLCQVHRMMVSQVARLQLGQAARLHIGQVARLHIGQAARLHIGQVARLHIGQVARLQKRPGGIIANRIKAREINAREQLSPTTPTTSLVSFTPCHQSNLKPLSSQHFHFCTCHDY